MKFNPSNDITDIIGKLLGLQDNSGWTQEECNLIVAFLSTSKIIEELESKGHWTNEWQSALENELFERNILAEEDGNNDSK